MYKKRLDDVATITMGHTFRSGIRDVPGGQAVVVQLSNLSPSPARSIMWQDCLRTELEGKGKPNWLRPDDILIPARGASFLPVLVDGIAAGCTAVAVSHCFVLRPEGEGVSPAYLAWWLGQPPVQRYLERNLQGSVIRSVSRAVLKEAPVMIPPLARQERIVALARLCQQEDALLQRQITTNRDMMHGIARDLAAAHSSSPFQG